MKQLIGTVVSNKMEKTVVVKVDRVWRHPVYKKAVKRSKKYLAHSNEALKVGDKVIIIQTRPVSKKKRWRVIKVNK